MRLDRYEETELLECGDDRLARLEAIHASKWRWGIGNDARGLIENGRRWQVVTEAHLAVVRVVCRGDLHRARAEAHLHKRIGNHRNGAVHEWHHHTLPNKCGVARVVGVHGHTGIAEERLWSRRGNHHAAGGVASL